MKPGSRTVCWVIVTWGRDCSPGFTGDLWGLLPGPTYQGSPGCMLWKLCNVIFSIKFYKQTSNPDGDIIITVAEAFLWPAQILATVFSTVNKIFMNDLSGLPQDHISWGLTFINPVADCRTALRIDVLFALALQIISV